MVFGLALLIYLDAPWWVWVAFFFSLLADVRFIGKLREALKGKL